MFILNKSIYENNIDIGQCIDRSNFFISLCFSKCKHEQCDYPYVTTGDETEPSARPPRFKCDDARKMKAAR